MPRFQPGPTTQKRAWSLIEALVLAKVSSEAKTVVKGVKLEYINWTPGSKSAPQIRVKAQLTELSKLTNSKLDGEQVREIISLYLGEKFLGILDDKRRIKHGKGSENWHFILTLWSADLEDNRQQFSVAWQRRKSGDTEESVSLDLLEPAQNLQDNGSDIDDLVREVRSRCCDKILHLYSKIQLLNRQQIDVDQLYVDVYVLEKLSSESHATIPDLLKGSNLREDFDRLGLGSRQKRSPGFEVAAHYPKLMILGKPGSGKSTFLRHLAIACCKGEFQAEHIPILLELRFIKDASQFNLLNIIHRECGLADRGQTEEILNQGKVLILLDGLDEVPGQSRRDVQEHTYEFSQQYYKNRFILTCRTQTTEYTLSTFDYVEVAPFKPEQVEIFAKNWFTALAETPEQGAELTVKFLDKLRVPENKQTAELAVTPILLSLTCWVFNDLKDLSPKRSDLYEQGINLLLGKWDEKRGVRRELGSEAYRKLSVGEKKKLLCYLAARKFEQKQYVLFEQGELQGYIAEYLRISTEDSEAVLDAVAVQHGLLIERAQGFWSFSHLTFQEYLTAKWFCDRVDWDGLVSHISDKHWREVFLLAAEMSSTANSLLLLMKQRVDVLVAADEKCQQFLISLTQKSFSLKLFYKSASIRAFCFTLDIYLHSNFLLYEKWWFGTSMDNSNANLTTRSIDKVLTSRLTLPYVLDPNFAIPLELIQNLQLLKEQVPALSGLESARPNRHPRVYVWTKKIRALMSKYCYIGNDWQWTDKQWEVLKQYYDANKLLVDCLNSDCIVSAEVREEIEETLLLPINEIKKRRQEVQVTDLTGE